MTYKRDWERNAPTVSDEIVQFKRKFIRDMALPSLESVFSRKALHSSIFLTRVAQNDVISHSLQYVLDDIVRGYLIDEVNLKRHIHHLKHQKISINKSTGHLVHLEEGIDNNSTKMVSVVRKAVRNATQHVHNCYITQNSKKKTKQKCNQCQLCLATSSDD